MPIPTFDKLLRPVLVLASQKPFSRRLAHEALTIEFRLTPEEAAQALASGGSMMGNRVGWAFTFLTKAGLIEKSAPRFYKATQHGVDFLKTHPTTITVKDLETIPGYNEAWELSSAKRRGRQQGKIQEPETIAEGHATPQELIEREMGVLRAELRSRLIESIVAQTPEFFERLVLDVLVAMGYGGTREDAAEHLGQSGDEGIDGRINQDTLGLDQILVQAKRYRPDRKIDRKEVQAFIGSLSGQGVTKGVFITTSSFQDSAHEFVSRGLNTKVVLVDGGVLIDLMIRHRVGVRVLKTHEIHEVDQNYFEEEI